jgi:hypothetical protein
VVYVIGALQKNDFFILCSYSSINKKLNKMNSRSIGFIGTFVLLIIPFLGFHVFTLTVGLYEFNSYCDELFMPLPYWLIISAVQGLTFFSLGVVLLGMIHWLKSKCITWFFSGLILLNIFFQIVWSIVGMTSLFSHVDTCLDNSKLLWIVVLSAVVLQILSIILTILFKLVKECCILIEPSEENYSEINGWNDKRSIYDQQSVWDQ